MKKTLGYAVLLAAAMATGGALADDSLFTPFHADYDLERDGLGSAHSVFTLERGADGSYIYKSVMHATGLAAMFFSDVITETSSFTVADGRPRAKSYNDSQTGKHPSSETISFDWDKGMAVTDNGGRTRRNKLTDDEGDVQLVQLQIGADVAAGKLADHYRTLDDGEIVDYAAQAMPAAKVRIGSVVYDTKAVALHDAAKGRTITVWLASTLHYLPVRIRQEQTGKKAVTLTLEDISFGSAAAPEQK